MKRSVRFAILLTSLLVAFPAGAQPAQDSRVWSDRGVAITPLFTWQHHGSFRFRFQNLYRLDLGAGGASGFGQTLDSTAKNDPLGESRGSVEFADIRFRYEPSLLVGEFLAIHARVDFLDNLILGSNPSSASRTSASAFFASSVAPPQAGVNGFRDSVRVKAAWADLKLFGRLHLYAGRMPEHFGLGIVRNEGAGLDSDWGDYADGFYLKAPLASTYFRIGLEFPSDGVTADSPIRPYGPTRDASQTDDVVRWVFSFDTSPLEKDDFEARARRLNVERKPAVDWGMYHSITWQDVSSDRVGGRMPAACGSGERRPFGLAYDCYTLTPRESFFWTPSLWGRLEYRPAPDMALTVEMEAAMVYGHVNYMQSFLDTTKAETKKDFVTVGGALESELRVGANRVSLLAGAATGDSSSRRFGVLDGSTLMTVDDTRYSLDPAVANNGSVRNFLFNRGYRVDSILFREVIGTVTNAFYFKPGYSREFLQTRDHALLAGASLLAAFAAVPEGTPGSGRGLGIEPNLNVTYRFKQALTTQVDAAVLFPLSGLKAPGATEDPKMAMALRVLMGVEF